ncbi:acyl-CoA dehydratase activase-related protein [Clostridium estertheticum]|uniref:Acyl-CoA dehydratase activase-related protein n=1 Tax=Clostridium estertheticum TaxID=238834 RepID=A0AA47I5V8_9CLOT|nr:acyl-CoA dehydratase activase-related protein [Clostridium estertheticum]MBU3155945.1 2-hydroxyglutaryl-CoA dehydratase [Clostridium estertheticum]MBU3200558.1 2-hydroxyglutaryl-CoA dehydratase [Clostridium estertheticum]WAG59150.1 acyl-CoA dehydratase activase-related protein [Clostridium estertheticum]WAG66797.1 acyl-CoA dehydratase activase-related protein [Clostridium estertheticum]
MKITFPHFGNTHLAAKALFDGLGIECIIAPFNSSAALELGSTFSPEEMCLPYKIMMGNYLQSIKLGADTILLPGSCGPCRFGEYCELQINALKKMGHNLTFIVVDSPFDIGKNEFLNRLSKISNNSKEGKLQKIKALKVAYTVNELIDKIESKVHYLTGFEVNKGQFKNLLKECTINAANALSPPQMVSILKEYNNKIDNVPINKDKTPIKIAIIGEIYTIIEPFANLYIEDKLMDYGVSTKRKLTPTWWIKNALLSPFKLNSIDIRKASKEYLPYYIGGHARECVGEMLLAEKESFDGAIQIFPMGCMPEIVSKAILTKISSDKDFPIMTLIVDEMTGEAGYITRIEAFVDMLERRKNNVLYGS